MRILFPHGDKSRSYVTERGQELEVFQRVLDAFAHGRRRRQRVLWWILIERETDERLGIYRQPRYKSVRTDLVVWGFSSKHGSGLLLPPP